jgi:excisionase family DNA binding protein
MANLSNQILNRLDTIESLIRQEQIQLLTLDEAALYLRLSRSYLYKLTSTSKIAFSKPNGKVLYFTKHDLDDWATSSRVLSQGELEQKAIDYTNSIRRGRK